MKILAIALLGSAVALSGCGGGGDSGSANDITLSAGQSVTLSAGETAMVPSGVTVNDHGSTVTVNGHHNTINVHAGAVVTVPAGASGAADNSVVAQ